MGGEAVIGHPLSSVFNGRYKNEQTKEQENGDGEGPFFGYEIYFSDGSADTVDDYKLY